MASGAFSILDLSLASEAYAQNEDSHITIRGTFVKDGAAVDVSSPSFTLWKDGSQVTIPSENVLLPIQKEYPADDEDGVGKYITTFLSNGLSAGEYTVKFTGTYDGDQIEMTGTLTLAEVNRTQWFIDALRAQLADKWIFEVPHNYLLHPNHYYWEDGELYAHLKRAVDDVNMADPVTPNQFELSNVPCASFVLLGGQFYALTSKAIKEAVNFYDTNFEVRVTVNKQDRFMTLLNFFNQIYMSGLARWKKNYMFNEGDILKAVRGTRVPSVVLRPLAMDTGYHSIFPG